MKRGLKLTLWGLLTFLVLSLLGGFLYFRKAFQAPPNQLVLGRERATIPFLWEATDLAGRRDPYGAILLPVTLPGETRTFALQFDLGAPTSLFYRGKLESIAQHCGGCLTLVPEPKGRASLRDYTFKLGDLPVTARRIGVRTVGDAGIDWDHPETIETIGTIGADLIDGRVAILDYPGGTLTLTRTVPERLALPAQPPALAYKERRVLLSAILEGRETQILFDTGSSAFELLTDANSWARLARPGAANEVLPMKSWDRTLLAHRAPTDAKIELGGRSLLLGHVTYIEGTSFAQNLLMRWSGMGGMTGNRLFVDKVLVLDVPGGRYALLDAPAARTDGASSPAL